MLPHRNLIARNRGVSLPKRPSLAKNTTESEFRYGERKFGTDVANCYGEGSEMLVFLGKRGSKTVQNLLGLIVGCLEGCKGYTHKRNSGKVPKVMKFRDFQGVFMVFSGCFSLCPFRVCPLDPSKLLVLR